MSSIRDIILKLNKFSDHENVQSAISKLRELESPSKKDDECFQLLRKNLQQILNNPENENVISDGLSLHDTVYEALLDLTKLRPLNAPAGGDNCYEDPITLEEIGSGDKTVVALSTGFLFDIRALAKHINEKNDFTNPITNTLFSFDDIKTILSTCTDNNIDLRKTQRTGVVQAGLFAQGVDAMRAGQIARAAAIGEGVFIIEDISEMTGAQLDQLIQIENMPIILQFMKQGPNGEAPLFSVVDVSNMDAHELRYLAYALPELQKFLQPGANNEPPLFRISDILHMNPRALFQLKNSGLIQAIKDGDLTIDVVANMTADELARMNDSKNYSPLLRPAN